jgi:hypothetical protein
MREVGFRILVCEIINTLNDQKWKDILIFVIHTNNYYRLFPIAWLYSLSSATSIGIYNNHPKCDLAYHKAGLVEVIEIAVHYIIFRLYILY